jgi:hypothetical protein
MASNWLRRATGGTLPHNQSQSNVKAVINPAAKDHCQHDWRLSKWKEWDLYFHSDSTHELAGSTASCSVMICDCKWIPSALSNSYLQHTKCRIRHFRVANIKHVQGHWNGWMAKWKNVPKLRGSIKTKLNSMVWVREQTIPTERPPLFGEVIVNFCG